MGGAKEAVRAMEGAEEAGGVVGAEAVAWALEWAEAARGAVGGAEGT